MGLLDTIRQFVPGALAERTGYLQGQDVAKERNLQQQQLALQNARNSLLDQLRAAVDSSTIDRNNALAIRDTRPPVPKNPVIKPGADGTLYSIDPDDPTSAKPVLGEDGEPIKAAPPKKGAPKTMSTSQGIMQWDEDSGTWKKTGFTPPPRANAGGVSPSTARADAKAALDEATKAIPRPSKVPQNILGTDTKGRSAMVTNPAYGQAVADSTAYDANVLSPLRQKLYEATGFTPPGATTPKSAPSATPTATQAGAPSTPQLSPAQVKARQAEYDDASRDYQNVLSSNAPADVKKRARTLYNQHQAEISAKYAAMAGGGDEPE